MTVYRYTDKHQENNVIDIKVDKKISEFKFMLDSESYISIYIFNHSQILHSFNFVKHQNTL